MSILALKSGVGAARIAGMTPQAALGIVICYTVYASHGYDLTVTCVTDGKHSNASLHYIGNAWDMRSNTIPAAKREEIRLACKTALGDDYDVIVEGDHIHAEYQPKTGVNT